MNKRTRSRFSIFAVVLAACVFMTLAVALPAGAAPNEAPEVEKSLSIAPSVDMQTQASTANDIYLWTERGKVYQARGATQVYNLSEYKSYSWDYDVTPKVSISTSGTGKVECKRLAGGERFKITGKKSGKVKVTYSLYWTNHDSVWVDEEPTEENDYSYGHYEDVAVKQSEKHTFYIYVLDLKNISGAKTKVVASASASPYSYSYSSPYVSKSFTFKIKNLPSNPDVSLVSDSNKKGSSYISKASKGKVILNVSGLGTHKIKLKAYGKIITCKAVIRALSMKNTSETKYTGSLTTYPGKTSSLAVKLTGIKSPKVEWSSTNTGVATVDGNGKVTAKGVGRCYIKAKNGGATVKMLVEVTTPGAYWAIQNGYSDMNYPLTYSQDYRMSPAYRDCSSFVSRCYWDPSNNRYICAIGDYAGTWALTAAGQGEWLCNQGRTVSWNACDIKKLRPGDTIYFETQYRGQNDRWCHIDHAALYVGNGYYLHTGGYGGKGTVGLSRYWAGDSSVRFIGRPCPW